jgi:hypothetical protein
MIEDEGDPRQPPLGGSGFCQICRVGRPTCQEIDGLIVCLGCAVELSCLPAHLVPRTKECTYFEAREFEAEMNAPDGGS